MLEGCAVWINFQGITDKSNLIPEELFFSFGCLIASKSFLSFYEWGGACPPIPTTVPPRQRIYSFHGTSSHFSSETSSSFPGFEAKCPRVLVLIPFRGHWHSLWLLSRSPTRALCVEESWSKNGLWSCFKSYRCTYLDPEKQWVGLSSIRIWN